MALSCIVWEVLVENREIFIPHLYLAPPQVHGDPVVISQRTIGLLFMVKKLRRCVKQTPGRDRQTDRQTELLYQYQR